jgi:hypothetical protein
MTKETAEVLRIGFLETKLNLKDLSMLDCQSNRNHNARVPPRLRAPTHGTHGT